MTSDEDMDRTFHDIATAGLSVVRTWAFNDVSQKPPAGTYFQILQGGQATINEGADGLQRLDKVVATAKKYDVKLIFTLTNNWNPEREEPATPFKRWNDNPPLPRGYLSNDYGGMDLYNRNFESKPTHDDFYTNPTIINAFKNYIAHVVPRYVNNPTVLGWELANDPRCASTLPASSKCNTTTITQWVNNISGYIKSLDSTHLVTAGDGGFYCDGCEKLFAPATSKKQSSPGGPTFDGSFGVDTEDIISVPCIDFGSFQLFPDQVQYFPGNLPKFATDATLQGSHWITRHSTTATDFKKPEALTAFSIVTEDHWADFVPFNRSARSPPGAPCGGVTDLQRNFAYVSWPAVGLNGNVAGALEFQWLQPGLEDVPHVNMNHKRQTQGNPSPQDGNANYNNGQNQGTAQQYLGRVSM
jgi:mannan endo-1,4-beta-mannosidase